LRFRSTKGVLSLGVPGPRAGERPRKMPGSGPRPLRRTWRAVGERSGGLPDEAPPAGPGPWRTIEPWRSHMRFSLKHGRGRRGDVNASERATGTRVVVTANSCGRFKEVTSARDGEHAGKPPGALTCWRIAKSFASPARDHRSRCASDEEAETSRGAGRECFFRDLLVSRSCLSHCVKNVLRARKPAD